MNKKFYFGMSVDDVALDGWSKSENFLRLVEFFNKENLPATFFVVPVDEATDRPFYTLSPEYVPAMRKAQEEGHCFAQHGIRHNRFELGVPPAMILDLPHEAENRRYASEHRKDLEQEHSIANCRARLKQGRDILENALGFRLEGFRAPALQESPGMFAALAEEGYKFDSSACLQETGWDYIQGNMEVPPRAITRERYEALRRKSGCPIFPLTTDYTWYLNKEKYAKTMELALHDLRACMVADIPFITVCHIDPVQEGEGIPFLHELYERAREEAAARGLSLEFSTIADIADKAG